MKKEIRIKAPAKVNIALDVLGVRKNGYHEMCMVNHSVALHDVLSFSEAQEGIVLSCNEEGIPTDESNIVWKVAQRLREKYAVDKGVKIFIDKQIPSEAGLAGGSADGAAALIGLNRLWDLNLTLDQLYHVGAEIGADIPYCCFKGTALVEGIGEVIKPIKPLNRLSVVLVKPEIDIATPWAFKTLDAVGEVEHPNIRAVIKAIELEDYEALRECSGNVFEQVVFERYPEVREIKTRMYAFDAVYATMSGSGSTVVGYFETKTAAKAAAEVFKEDFQNTFLTEIE